MMDLQNISDLDELKLHLKNLLVEDTGDTLEQVATIINPKSKKINELILHRAGANRIKKESRQGVIGNEDRRVLNARLVVALGEYIDELKEGDLKDEVKAAFAMNSGNAEEAPVESAGPTGDEKPLVALLVFSNDDQDPLGNLKEEEKEIKSALLHFRKAGGNIEVVNVDSLDEVFNYFNLYKGQIGLVHYGGHASGTGLKLDGKTAQAKGLAELMGSEPNLSFVFLNGCATAGQVEIMQKHNVRAMLATSVPISDAKATQFAARFYQNLAFFGATNSLEDAFKYAKSYTETTAEAPIEIRTTRGFVFDDGGEKLDAFNWSLYEHPKFQGSLAWKLPKTGVSTSSAPQPAAPVSNTGGGGAALSDTERASLQKQKEILEKKIAYFEEKLLLGGLSADQEFAIIEQLEKMKIDLQDIKAKLN